MTERRASSSARTEVGPLQASTPGPNETSTPKCRLAASALSSQVGSPEAGEAASEPPLYYAFESIPYSVGEGGSLLDRLQLMRLLSASLAGLTALFTFLFLRETLPGTRRAWTVGALGVAVAAARPCRARSARTRCCSPCPRRCSTAWRERFARAEHTLGRCDGPCDRRGLPDQAQLRENRPRGVCRIGHPPGRVGPTPANAAPCVRRPWPPPSGPRLRAERSPRLAARRREVHLAGLPAPTARHRQRLLGPVHRTPDLVRRLWAGSTRSSQRGSMAWRWSPLERS
jgi:hypothetical protein